MPALNYVDIGDVLSHDYLRGVITAIDASDDTCSADVDGRTMTGIPLFFSGGPVRSGQPERRTLPTGYWSIMGAELDFEVGDSVLMMIGRGAYSIENFVLGHVTGKQLRYYLADFKRLYALNPDPYYYDYKVDHYAPDQVKIRPYWFDIVPYVYPVFGIPVQADETPKKDWFFEIPIEALGDAEVYHILIVETAPDGHYLDSPVEGMPYRPSPLGRTYTFKSVININSETAPMFWAELGYWDIGTDSFVPLRSLHIVQLILGTNLVTFDFLFEDLYLGADDPGYTVALRAYMGNDCRNITWRIYSILPKEVIP